MLLGRIVVMDRSQEGADIDNSAQRTILSECPGSLGARPMRAERTVYEPVDAIIKLPAAAIEEFEGFSRCVVASSAIVWGEHCSECAVPKCYSTCSYYSPRADLTCRRFVGGIEPVRATGSERLHRVRFRKWGKLEARGPVSIHPAANLQFYDGVRATASAILTAVPQTFRLRRHLVWRWNNAQKQLANRPVGLTPQSFVIEACAIDGLSHPFTVTFLAQHAKRIYQERFEINPTYGRLQIPVERIRRHIDLTEPYLVQIEPSGQTPECDVVLGVADFVNLRTEERGHNKPAPHATYQSEKKVKVIVWDLDNTLWDGILAEDGVEGVKIRPHVTEVIKELDKRGILHSIASKNSMPLAMKALAKFDLVDYFLCPQIGWEPKSDSIRTIAHILDLDIDSFVFVDDQEFERAEVKEAHPSIRVLSDTTAAQLPTQSVCDVATTAESKSRRLMYRAEALRSATLQTTKTDYCSFLRSCNIVLKVTQADNADRERIYELSQRSNQLNFCGTKYSRGAVDELISGASNTHALVLRCADKFGDYGAIGFVVVDFSNGVVLDLFMSCRVQRKYVENAFFSVLAEELLKVGHRRLLVRAQKTERNGASFDMLKQLGFEHCAGFDAPNYWERDLAAGFDKRDIVEVDWVSVSTRDLVAAQ